MPDGDEFSQKQLEAAVWYVKHKVVLRRVALGGIILIDGILVAYSLFGAGRDLLSIPLRKKHEFELLRTAIPSGAVTAVVRPLDLQLGGVELLTGGNVIDVVARVRNPNPSWYVQFDYTIGVSDKIETIKGGFLLPGEERPFVRTIQSTGAGTVVFNIENVTWRRITPREAPNFEEFRNERLSFEVTDAEFTPGIIEGVTPKAGSASRVKFKITNKGAYSYVEPEFLVMLFRGSRLVGIQATALPQFRTGQTREVELTWFDRVGAVSNVEVLPEIDILNSEVYLK